MGKVKPSKDPYQAGLLTGKTMIQQENENELKAAIANCREELEWIKEMRDNSQGWPLIVMDVERYGGSSCPWYLNLSNDPFVAGIDREDLEEEFRDMPNPYDYDIGSYWTKSQSPGTYKFIHARLKWAEEYFANEMSKLEKELQMSEHKVAFFLGEINGRHNHN